MLNLVISEPTATSRFTADCKIVDEAGIEAARFQRNLYKDGDESSRAAEGKAEINTDVRRCRIQHESIPTFLNSSSW
jgi:hypothetical protein